MIELNENITIDEKDISFVFSRSAGPGGQNVNKVSTAVCLKFNIKESASINDTVKARLYTIAENKINSRGELIISSNTYRTQLQNKKSAMDKLADLIEQASRIPKKRKKIKPSLASKHRRLESKKDDPIPNQ